MLNYDRFQTEALKGCIHLHFFFRSLLVHIIFEYDEGK